MSKVKKSPQKKKMLADEVDFYHTPEPWSTDGTKAIYARGRWGRRVHMVNCMGQDAKANARRIEACINAFDGIPTRVIEASRHWMDYLWWTVEHLENNPEVLSSEELDKLEGIAKLLEVWSEQ